MNDDLRKQVRLLKAIQGVSYKEIASYLEINANSLYNWLRADYDFSDRKQRDLQTIISTLKE